LPKDGSTPLTSLHGPFGDAHIKPLLEKLTSNGICNCNVSLCLAILSQPQVATPL
jgi:hypothetical protein